MGRIHVCVVVTALVLVGCSGSANTEPAAPRSVADLSDWSAVEESALRGAALAFLEAYAAVQAEGTAELEALAATPFLRAWAHWLGVQRDEFAGTGEATLAISAIGPSQDAPIEDTAAVGRLVELVGGLSFDLNPIDEDPFSFDRVVDGPMLLLQAEPGWWVVLDLTRDGVPLSSQFQPLRDPVAVEAGEVSVSLEAAFVAPTWQFGVGVEAGPRATGVRTARLVTADGVLARANEITASLDRVAPERRVEGLITFDRQQSTAGMSLQLVLAPSGRTVDIALDGSVRSIEDQLAQDGA